MKTRSFSENLMARMSRISDSLRGVKYIEPEEYFRRNTSSTDPKGYPFFPQYIKDWLFKTYADKGDCLVMKSPLHPSYSWDIPQHPLVLTRNMLDMKMIDLVNAGYLEMKPRYEIEHDPRYFQLIVSCFIITPVGNVVGVRNLKHPRIENILSIPQGHVEGVENINSKRLFQVCTMNMKRELDEELEFMLNGKTESFNIFDIKLNGIDYYPDFSPEHIFISYILDMRGRGIDKPLNIVGKEDYNMVEVYALEDVDKVDGDFLFDKYFRSSHILPGGESMKHYPYETVVTQTKERTIPSLLGTERVEPINAELLWSESTELKENKSDILEKLSD